MGRSHRLSVSLDDDLYEALALEAEEAGRSLADVIRDRLRASVLGDGAVGEVRNVGELAESLLAQGLTNEAVLTEVRRRLPDAKTSLASVAWYRSNMKRRGLSVISQVEARRKAASALK
ncbi:ribbon-helix-helix protein, CopG family [Albimonas sp. CAU 1670]|uniref:ribbon-helix-helix protein, CopG family n=1 Tax=Albimonas sp. CAU 1670 TaxID=3032599 RepID=UPI0023D995AA|nr:ribbon-helix-helix protein, CopG family [Albimonas sp. CAU 1670]MDF2231579.1 ribbon-helix-helix protein, CopG family [Albimonas sp. CAU 1670]